MQTREVVGIGRTAEVLAWEEGKVIKLYYPSFPRDNAEHEARIAESIQNASLPGPKYYGMVELDGRPGLIYDRISGPALFSWLEKRPWKIDYIARLMAELQYRIHQLPAPGAPNQRKRLENKINNANILPPEKKQKALAILAALPDGDRLCHNDFHPGNILMTDRGPIVIDWVDVTVGNPLADVGRTALLLRSAHIPEDFPARRLLLLFRHRLHDIYLRSYARLANIPLEDIRAWDYPLTAARLDENITEENESLLHALE